MHSAATHPAPASLPRIAVVVAVLVLLSAYVIALFLTVYPLMRYAQGVHVEEDGMLMGIVREVANPSHDLITKLNTLLTPLIAGLSAVILLVQRGFWFFWVIFVLILAGLAISFLGPMFLDAKAIGLLAGAQIPEANVRSVFSSGVDRLLTYLGAILGVQGGKLVVQQ